MMLYAVNGTCRDSIRIGSLEDDHICGYGSRFQFSDDDEVEKFDLDHSLLSQTVKNRNIFDWMTVDLTENSINLFVQRYNRKFRIYFYALFILARGTISMVGGLNGESNINLKAETHCKYLLNVISVTVF